MGQALQKIASGAGLFPFQTEGAVASAFQGADDLPRLVKALSTELEEMASEDRSEEKKAKEIGPTIEECYDKHFAEPTKEFDLDEFYRAVCETVEEINKKLGNTQFRVPKDTTLHQAYKKHLEGKTKSLTKEKFQEILQEVIVDTGFTGIGAKDTLFYIFGVPVAALMIKQRVMPRVISNDIFIPGITSATVFILAKLNKI
ncbi:hypothetical protein CJ030_MR2G023458 [Morella rubra]|uniref:Uncharacterized protein n=1 Tax=Morella rubra TaxID=262757 RepID=A0A6A1WH97_9ROSI|nr:hypothetical protein CJ030_MR2G023433 [Morella rubra]KAB1222220.1 hypothetical protein CJ030_MR2G023458 [Morella rubra]